MCQLTDTQRYEGSRHPCDYRDADEKHANRERARLQNIIQGCHIARIIGLKPPAVKKVLRSLSLKHVLFCKIRD